MRGFFKLLWILTAVAFIWGGAGDTYIALTNRAPTALTCGQFEQNRPGAKWLSLTECEMKLDDVACVRYRKAGVVEGYYVPLVPRGAAHSKTSLLLRATSKEQLAKLASQREYLGVVQFGLESSEAVREALKSSNLALADYYVILDPDQTPQLGRSAALLCIGLFLAAAMLRRILRTASAAVTATPSQSPASASSASATTSSALQWDLPKPSPAAPREANPRRSMGVR